MIDAHAAAAALLPGKRIEPVEALRGRTSAQVQRVIVHGADGPTPLVVKAFTSAGEDWAREAAALSVLGDRGIGARLVAESNDPPTVVMTDLGPGPSLADRLLGDDPSAAAAATAQWATALPVCTAPRSPRVIASATNSTAGRATCRSRRTPCPRCWLTQRQFWRRGAFHSTWPRRAKLWMTCAAWSIDFPTTTALH